MEKVSIIDKRVIFPAFYNCYPILNEVAFNSISALKTDTEFVDYFHLDDYYGRFLKENYYEQATPYGSKEAMKYYPNSIGLDIVDEFQVPYRKIPIFQLESLSSLNDIVISIRKENPDFDILLRGQTKTYYINREDHEKIKLFGDREVKEPSFLPSHLRNDFDEIFMQSLWQSQADYLLRYIEGKLHRSQKWEQLSDYQANIRHVREGHLNIPFSLGIAQHYGLPSIGLDLTTNIEVAAWFACNSIRIDSEGQTTTNALENTDNSTIYVFRCPRSSVYSYQNIKPAGFPEGRPDRQSAWFSHVGWGYAKNQLASYLISAFKINSDIHGQLPKNFEAHLFPSISDDQILEYFISARKDAKYVGEVKRALQKIYYLP
jgi:hypothetical protein